MSDPEPHRRVRVALGPRSYDILIGDGLVAGIGGHLMTLIKRQRVFILSDETVWGLHGGAMEAGLSLHGIKPIVHTLSPGEHSKSWDQLGAVLSWLLDQGAGRDDLLMAFGGGVVGDLAGLAAALMKRGMGLVQVPTTLLAQVDSSVGGKTAVNTPHGKNLIGAFYQPRLVLADTGLLATLPDRERRAGYAEIVKYGLIDAPDFFDWLEDNGPRVMALESDALTHAVAVSCESKARIVAQDEREGGVRALLNLGHTFGHTLEAANGYGPSLLHGEAVGTGMALALRYSVRLGLTTTEDAERACAVLRQGGLQPNLGHLSGGPYEAPKLADAMRQDKKVRAGRVPLILARGIGKAFIHPNADLADVSAFLGEELQASR
ncbi:MAG: 3-dehydroquinate synthase [Pseudomonadota bacterium]